MQNAISMYFKIIKILNKLNVKKFGCISIVSNKYLLTVFSQKNVMEVYEFESQDELKNYINKNKIKIVDNKIVEYIAN